MKAKDSDAALDRLDTSSEPHAAAAAPPSARPLAGGAAALLAAGVMAGYVVLGKVYVSAEDTGGDPGVLLLCRQLIASVLMVAGALCKHGWMLPRPEHRRTIHVLGALNFVNALGFVWGFKLTSAFITSVMQLSIPVFTMAYSAARGDERLSVPKCLSVLTVVGGCIFVTVASATQLGAAGVSNVDPTEVALTPPPPSWQLYVGSAVLLAQCWSFVGIVVVQKPVLEHYPVAMVVGWSYVLCTCWSCVYCALDGSILRVGKHLESSSGMAIVLYSAVAGAALYFELIAFATKQLTPTLVAISVSVEPLLVSLFGVLFFAYRPTPYDAVGYALAALGAVALAVTYARAPPPARRRRRAVQPPRRRARRRRRRRPRQRPAAAEAEERQRVLRAARSPPCPGMSVSFASSAVTYRGVEIV